MAGSTVDAAACKDAVGWVRVDADAVVLAVSAAWTVVVVERFDEGRQLCKEGGHVVVGERAREELDLQRVRRQCCAAPHTSSMDPFRYELTEWPKTTSVLPFIGRWLPSL